MKSVIWSRGMRFGAPAAGTGAPRSAEVTTGEKAAGWPASRSSQYKEPERPFPSANRTMCDKRNVSVVELLWWSPIWDPAGLAVLTKSYLRSTTPALSNARSSSGVDSFIG